MVFCPRTRGMALLRAQDRLHRAEHAAAPHRSRRAAHRMLAPRRIQGSPQPRAGRVCARLREVATARTTKRVSEADQCLRRGGQCPELERRTLLAPCWTRSPAPVAVPLWLQQQRTRAGRLPHGEQPRGTAISNAPKGGLLGLGSRHRPGVRARPALFAGFS
jgi:hypothetical protein